MKYKADDVILDTDQCTGAWNEATRLDGNYRISLATGRTWDHETLYRSKKGRYYIVHTRDWNGSRATAEIIKMREAAQWLILNDHELPPELQHFKDEVIE